MLNWNHDKLQPGEALGSYADITFFSSRSSLYKDPLISFREGLGKSL